MLAACVLSAVDFKPSSSARSWVSLVHLTAANASLFTATPSNFVALHLMFHAINLSTINCSLNAASLAASRPYTFSPRARAASNKATSGPSQAADGVFRVALTGVYTSESNTKLALLHPFPTVIACNNVSRSNALLHASTKQEGCAAELSWVAASHAVALKRVPQTYIAASWRHMSATTHPCNVVLNNKRWTSLVPSPPGIVTTTLKSHRFVLRFQCTSMPTPRKQR